MKITSFFIRCSILIFWSAATLLFLYAPSLVTRKPLHSITVLAWPNTLDRERFSVFEKKTGIKVYMTYFENYEELFVKLKSGGSQGYDVIMTSDYMAELLIKEDLLAPLDKKRCPFWDRLDPQFLGQYYDPTNQFTVPIALSLYGIGVDTDYFGGVVPEATWGLLFDKQVAPEYVGMPDDAREVILIAAQYMYGSIENLDDDKLAQIKHMLRAQKEWVEMYSDLRTDYLLFSKTAPVVAAMHPDLAYAVSKSPNILFLLPKEGVFGVLDSMALVKGSENEDKAYAFLDFLYQQDTMSYYVKQYKFIPTLSDVPAVEMGVNIATSTIMSTIHFFRNVLDPQKLMDTWISIKS